MKNILKKYSLLVCLMSLFLCVHGNVSAATDYFSVYKDNIRVVLLESELSNIKSVDFTLKGSYIVDGTDITLADGAYTIKLESGSIAIYKSGALIKQFSNGESASISSQNYSSNLLTLSMTNRQYLGSFSFVNQGTYISIVNKLGIDEYLYGVVPSEISESSNAEALKSQAIAARTYAINKMISPAGTYFDLGNNTNYQVYTGYTTSSPKCMSAVDSTKGIILTYNGQPISAYFSSSNGGYTEKVENVWGSDSLAYSDSVQDTYDPKETWTRTYTTAEINSRLSSTIKATTGDFTCIDLNSITRYPSGRVSNITIKGTNGTMSFSKNSARMFLAVGNVSTDLKSSMYSVTYNSTNDTYTFTGTGFGHGVGMSQAGAQNRAVAGQKYSDILSFYYPNSKQENYFLTVQGITPSNPVVNVGQSVSFATAATGGNQLQYQYHIYNYQTKTWTVATDYNTNSTLNWAFSSAGKYQVMCFVKDINSSSQYDSVAYSEVTANIAPVTLNGITPSSLNTYKGKQETFTVSASGGTSLLYQYHIYNYQTKIWTVATDYTNSPTLKWAFSDVGKYQVMCFVKDVNSTKQYDVVAYCETSVTVQPVTLNSITPSQLSTYKGNPETITVSASGGTSLLYQYHIYNYQTQQWSMVQNYSANATLKWTFTALGNYQVMCFIKDINSSKEYDAVAYCGTTVNAPPVTLNGITPAHLTTTVGEQETINVSASGGTTLMYQYNVYDYQKKVWALAQDYSTNPSLNWAFKAKGNYQVMCFVKDKTSSNQYDKVAYCEATVNENTTTVTMNTTSPIELASVKGKLETLTVNAGTSNSLLYQFNMYNYQTKTWSMVQDYSASPSLSWTFTSAGRYQVMCFVKDKSSTNQYDKVSYCEVTVAAAIVSGSYTVAIDAGHGGTDTGAIGITGVYEKNVNLPVALKVGALLKAAGVKVVYTRTTDATTSLQARCDAANNSAATYLVSIHSNAVDSPTVSGTETLYDTTDPKSLKLATAIQTALIEELGSNNRGLVDGNWLYLVNHTNSSCAVALAELGFLTNATEESLLVTDSYQNRCASAIADAIISCLNN